MVQFENHRLAWGRTTRRAQARFAERDWPALRGDSAERLLLYRRAVDDCERRVRQALGERLHERALWSEAKQAWSEQIADRRDGEQAESWWNSVTRRIFATAGVHPEVDFVDARWERSRRPPTEHFGPTLKGAELVRAVLDSRDWGFPLEDPAVDAELAGARIDEHLAEWGIPGRLELDLLAPVFYRGKAAYLVGRLRVGGRTRPLVLALRHGPDGVFIDAVLLQRDEVSKLFSFTRWYFLVDTDEPAAVVDLLQDLLPRKRASDLYISMGYTRHGKTELFRELRRHLAATDDRFVAATGTPGLVMVVFTLPGLDSVLKVIRDRFPPQKEVTSARVKDRYRLVHLHDRAGRLVDAQPFELLRFPRDRFDDALLADLLDECGNRVHVDGDDVVVDHAYVERRVTPLDVHVRTAPRESAEAAIWDFGDALRDLAACGIFPGDILPKNFGVTRHGRVAFYDYDELALIHELRFRDIPKARYEEDEMAAEPWFSVDPGDVFPEEFPRFFGLTPELLRVLFEHHAELFTAAWWRRVQEMVASGRVVEFAPYPHQLRIHSRPARSRTV